MDTKNLLKTESRRRKYFMVVGFLLVLEFCTFSVNAQQYQVISVTGFNQDVIAEGVGTAGSHRAQATTTTTFDALNTGACHVMYARNFRGDNNLSTAPPYGLVDNGFIVSASDANKRYQLANYTGNNTLLLTTLNQSGTLTFATSGCYSALSILASSGQSSSSFNVTVNFSDGTNAAYTFSVPDWYGGANYAVQGIGRVNRVPDIPYGGSESYDVFDGDASNPRLYDCNMTITGGNVNKLVQSITVTKNESGIGRCAILAVCGQVSSTVPGTPVATAGSSVLSTSFTANWNAVDNATSYRLDVSTEPNFATFVTGYNNLDAGNVVSTSVTGLTAGVAYYYRVRASNANGQSFNSNIINVGGLSAPVAIDATNKLTTSFSANWNSVSGATGYYLDVATDFYFQSLIENNVSVGNVTTSTVTGLTSGITYYYRVRASNTSYTSLSSNIVSTGLPVSPVTTYALNVGRTSFMANWSPVTATSYKIDVSTASNFSSFVSGYQNLDVGNVTSYTVTGLSASTVYYYRIRSVNASGVSVNSNVVTVTTGSFAATISPGNQTICSGFSPGTYTATGEGGTTPYEYLWYKNGASTGITTNTYDPGFLTSNTTLYCTVSDASTNTDNTSTVTITINPPAYVYTNTSTIASLQATGSGIKWYHDASGGSPLSDGTLLEDGHHYFASQTVSGAESTERFDVIASFDQTPCKPTGSASQAYSSGATVASLQATGSSIRWYTASSGGTALETTTVLVSGNHYWASQTIDCTESATRFEVTVTIN